MVNDILQAKGLLLRTGTAVDATLIAAPSSTKNAEGKRDPQMHRTRKGKQWYFGVKAHIGVDAQSGLVHTVVGTAANVSDINVAGAPLHGRAEAKDPTSPYSDAPGQAQIAQSVHLGAVQGRAPVPGDQAAVRLQQGALPGLGQEHGAGCHAARAVEPVDGAATFDRDCGDECVCNARIRL